MRGLEPLGESLDRDLAGLGLRGVGEAARLAENWEEVAGAEWAERARPAGLEGGTLTLEVSDGTSATLLKYNAEALLGRLAERLGPGIVDEVRIRVGKPKKAL